MEKAEILEILDDWNFWTKKKETGIRRDSYIQKLVKLHDTNQVIAIMGVRRSGKSTIMLQWLEHMIEGGVDPKNTLYINFEDVRFREFSLGLLNKIYDIYLEVAQPTSRHYIFLDEVHKIDGWERFARTMHELKKADVFVSGSNAKLMSGDLSAVLTGRHLDLEVFPLDFKEFLMFNNLQINSLLEAVSNRHKIKALLNEYLQHGGLPLVVLKKTKKELLQTYFEDILNKDIAEGYKIENIPKIKSLAKFYLTHAGRRISFNNLSKMLDLSLDTIERYSYYLEEVYLAFFIKKFSYSLKEQEKTMAIVYCIDNGLRNLLSFKFSEDHGWLYQNTVANSLIKRYGKENIFYWMSKTKEEVDFVVKEKTKIRQLIQVCYNLENIEVKKREITPLLKAGEELRCNNLLVVNEDKEGEEKIKGKKIRYVPLWKWLLLQEKVHL